MDAPSSSQSALASYSQSQPTTSGTAIDFTGIPDWVAQITVAFSLIATKGTSAVIVQIGDSGGFSTSGYVGGASSVGGRGSTAAVNYSTGFRLIGSRAAASDILSGSMTLTLLDSATNRWVESHNVARSDGASHAFGGGVKALSGALTQVRLTTENGTDAFANGSVNILYL